MTGKAFSGIHALMETHAIKQNKELILILIINDLLGGKLPHPEINHRVTAVKLLLKYITYTPICILDNT